MKWMINGEELGVDDGKNETNCTITYMSRLFTFIMGSGVGLIDQTWNFKLLLNNSKKIAYRSFTSINRQSLNKYKI